VTVEHLIARPFPGAGLICRAGGLLVACAVDPAADRLLALVEQVTRNDGDGAELIRRAGGMLAQSPLAAAVAGVTAEGAVAVLVNGAAYAEVTGPRERFRLAGPRRVHRVTEGAVHTLVLGLDQLTGPAPDGSVAQPDPRVRLDRGVVPGGGLVTDLTQLRVVVDAQEPAPAPRRPDPSQPFQAVLLVPEHAEPLPPEPQPRPVDPAATTGPLVSGVHCVNRHFTDPSLPYCAICGISLTQATHEAGLGRRPPLGVLLLDNGLTLRLDTDYVIGREPEFDDDVIAGRARPLRITGSSTGMSRRHLRLTLTGWEVQVTDLNSANGTVVQLPGETEPHRIAAGSPVVIRPGSLVGFNRRWLRYESHRNP